MRWDFNFKFELTILNTRHAELVSLPAGRQGHLAAIDNDRKEVRRSLG